MRIMDSHAHYAHKSYSGSFRYLVRTDDGYAVEEGDRAQLLGRLKEENILCSIEPGIGLASNGEILELCRQYPGQVYPAVGVHPTRTSHERWRARKQLMELAAMDEVIAVGETGLDYHYPRKEQHRLCQKVWFLYQLQVACRVKKPVILHVRDADAAALQILKRHPARKLGGVVHCFNRDWNTAQQYLALGYHIGVGGTLLQNNERGQALREAVEKMPLERILAETDAPFILPDCKEWIPSKVLRRTRNTSLILPAVIGKIAEIKGMDVEETAQIIWDNTVRLFGL